MVGPHVRLWLRLNPACGLIANLKAGIGGTAFDYYELAVSETIRLVFLVVGFAYPLPRRAVLRGCDMTLEPKFMPSTAVSSHLGLSLAELDSVARSRFGDPANTGPLPRLWYSIRYFIPDVFYEAMIAKLVVPGTVWLDVGCGRDLFPCNQQLAQAIC